MNSTAIRQTSRAADYVHQGLATLDTRVFVLLYGAILTAVGTAMIMGGLSATQVLTMPDPIFAVRFRTLMLIIGGTQLVVALLCLFTNRCTLALALAAWWSADFLVYRIGLWTMGWRQACGFLVDPLGLSPGETDWMLIVSSTVLVAGGLTTLWLERRAADLAGFLKMPCPSCGRHVKFAAQNLGQQTTCPQCGAKITLRSPNDRLKTTCYFCKGHIEFPAHALGQKLKCPHCNKDITLKATP